MSNQLQVISDLKTGLEQLSQRVEAVEATNARELAAVISRELEVTRRELIEGFTLKFIQSLDGPTDFIKRRVEDNRRQMERAEEQTEALEEKVRTLRAEIGGLLDEATARLSGSFKTHHARSEASLATFREKADAVGGAAMKIAEAAKLCEGFKRDYEETVTRSRHAMSYVTETMDSEVERLRNATEAIIERVEGIETGRMRRVFVTGGAVCIGMIIGFCLAFVFFGR